MKRILISIILLIVAIATYYMCTRKSQEGVKIGVILPLTGDRTSVGKSALNGIMLAINEINDSSAFSNDMQVFVEDSRGVPATAVSCFEKLVSLNQTPAIIGPIGSSEVLSVAPKAETKKVVILTPAASSPLITESGDYIFRDVASDLYEATLMAEVAFDKLSLKKVAVIYINNDYGIGVYNKFKEGFLQKGGVIPTSQIFTDGTTSFRTIIQKVKESNPDAIYIVGYKEIAYCIKQMKELGVSAQLLTTAIFEDPEIIEIVGNSAEGIIFTTFFLDEDSNEPRTKRFFHNYETKYGKKPDGYAATAYDAVYMIASAINKKGSSSAQIKDGLYAISDFPGLLGTFSVNKDGDITLPIKLKRMEGGLIINFDIK